MPEIDRIPEGLLLAAVKRAQLHQDRDEGVSLPQIKAHLGLRHNGWTTRQVRPQIESLQAAGLLEPARRNSRPLWGITPKGSRRAGAFSDLPESPQHRAWREARELAGQEIEGFEQKLIDTVSEAMECVERDSRSDVLLEIGERLSFECWRLASAIYCLREWAEPDDRRADIDKRVGRRGTRLWDR